MNEEGKTRLVNSTNQFQLRWQKEAAFRRVQNWASDQCRTSKEESKGKTSATESEIEERDSSRTHQQIALEVAPSTRLHGSIDDLTRDETFA